MDKYVFPAIFHPENDGGYSIHFPDLKGCTTEGEDLADGSVMAREVLELYLYSLETDGQEIPEPAGRYKMKGEDFVVMVTAHMNVIRAEMKNRAVKKTLTIPCWLNEEAEAAGINFSLVLQEALKEQLGEND